MTSDTSSAVPGPGDDRSCEGARDADRSGTGDPGPPTTTVGAGAGEAPSERAAPEIFARGEMVAGRFRISGLLGRGGGGQIYAARDLLLGEVVALKAVHPELAGRSGGFDLLRPEVLAARDVTHPNVCRIYDLFRHVPADGGESSRREVPVMAMELLEGETLAHRIRREGPLAPREAAAVAGQLAAGLAAAHAAGVLHLDFKSSNAVLTPAAAGERAVITDFGLARSARRGVSPEGEGRGTPGYMAPEQRRGDELSPATDVFAFGCVLHELFTGRLPEEGAGGLRSRGVPRRWRRLLAACLAESPEARPADGAALVAALPSGRPDSGPQRLRPVAAGVLAAMLMALLLVQEDSAGPPRSTPSDAPAISLSPESEEHYLRGLRSLRALDPVAARGAFEAVLDLSPDHVPARLALSEAWSAAGRADRARAEVLRAAEAAVQPGRGPGRTLELWLDARRLETAGRVAEASDQYRSLHALKPDDLGHMARLVGALLASDQAEQAARVIEPYLDGAPGQAHESLLALLEARVAHGMSDTERQLSAARRAADRAARRRQPGIEAEGKYLEALALWRLGRGDQGIGAMEAALDLFTRLEHSGGRLKTLTQLAALHCEVTGETELCAREYEEALALARDLGDRVAEAGVLVNSGSDAVHQGELALAEARYGRARSLYRELGSDDGLAIAVGNLALIHMMRDDFRRAEAAFEEALALRRRVGPPARAIPLLTNLGSLYGLRGEPRRARDAWEESVELAERHGDALMATLGVANLSRLTLLEGDADGAARQFEREVRPRLGALEVPAAAGIAIQVEGEIALARDREEQAVAAIRRAVELFEGVDNRGRAAEARLQLAAVHGLYGRPQVAEGLARPAIRTLVAAGRHASLVPGRHHLIQALVAQGRLEEAREALTALDEGASPEHLEHVLLVALARGRVALAAGEPESAIAKIERALEAVPPGYLVPLRFEATLLLAAAEAELERSERSTRLLEALVADAELGGFELFVRRASERLAAAEGSGARSRAPREASGPSR